MRSRNFLRILEDEDEDDALIRILCGGATRWRHGALSAAVLRHLPLFSLYSFHAARHVLDYVSIINSFQIAMYCSHRKHRKAQAVADNECAHDAQHKRSGTVIMTVNLIKYCHGVLTIT